MNPLLYIAEWSPALKSYTRWKHIPMCPLFRNIPTMSYTANVTGNDVRLATCIPNIRCQLFSFYMNSKVNSVFLRLKKAVKLAENVTIGARWYIGMSSASHTAGSGSNLCEDE